MATTLLASEFREFLKSLNSHGVEYLIVGGYAVNFHGYHRTTGDLDVWIAVDPKNAQKVAAALHSFGFETATEEHFLRYGKMTRMGVPPFRIEILTKVSAIRFSTCYAARVHAEMSGVPVTVIALEHLKRNKRASGRLKDLADVKHLEQIESQRRKATPKKRRRG
jgi:predicted nucleotidyltransferase